MHQPFETDKSNSTAFNIRIETIQQEISVRLLPAIACEITTVKKCMTLTFVNVEIETTFVASPLMAEVTLYLNYHHLRDIHSRKCE